MNKSILSVVVSAAILAITQASLAGEVTGLTSFTANTPAVAAQVNANFTAVKTAVDNNHARVTTLESNAASPNISGNLTLVPSTGTAGNVMKGANRFLHDHGTNNTFLGLNVGNFAMTGYNNTGIGARALENNTTGSFNSASGMQALGYNTTGGYNTANGVFALVMNSSGSQNTATGGRALYSNTTGINNSAYGYAALSANVTGTNNTASGAEALNATTDGDNNTASGYRALYANTTGHSNTASGAFALYSNTSNFNTASGLNALYSNTTGFANTAVGYNALYSNTTGFGNTALGAPVLVSNTTGQSNTVVGANALQSNTTGSQNIAIGVGAGFNLTTGNNNIMIDNEGVAGESNTTRFGSGQTRVFIAGIRGVTTGVVNAIPVLIDSSGQLGTVSSSRRVKDDIADMGESSNVLKQLRPVTFHYKTDQSPQGRSLQYGLVAEEVEKVAPGLVARSANGEIETVFYQHLTPMLLNEYQKQQRTTESQTALLKNQSAELARHAARVAVLEKSAQEFAELKAQLARMNALILLLQQPERVAAAK